MQYMCRRISSPRSASHPYCNKIARTSSNFAVWTGFSDVLAIKLYQNAVTRREVYALRDGGYDG